VEVRARRQVVNQRCTLRRSLARSSPAHDCPRSPPIPRPRNPSVVNEAGCGQCLPLIFFDMAGAFLEKLEKARMSGRAKWLCAFILGLNDGLMSVACLPGHWYPYHGHRRVRVQPLPAIAVRIDAELNPPLCCRLRTTSTGDGGTFQESSDRALLLRT
jgi:hypothetical protein